MNHLTITATSHNPHGGGIFEFAKRYALSPSEVCDFSASINPITPKVDWIKLQQQSSVELPHYPQEYSTSSESALKPILSQKFSVDCRFISLTKGISESIHHIFSAIQPPTCLLFTPIYSEYQKAAQQFSRKTLQTCLSPSQWLQNSTKETLPADSIVVLVNPSTPEGKCLEITEIKHLVDYCQQHKLWLLLDESFLPFISLSPEVSGRQYLHQGANLIILQSLTKYFACPGIRIGAIFAHLYSKNRTTATDLAETLNDSPPINQLLPAVWSLSTLDKLWLMQALQDSEHESQTKKWILKTKPDFLKQLKALDCILKIYPSSTNFVLLEFDRPVEIIQNHLATFSILIRNAASFGFNARTARIAIKSDSDNQKLIHALQRLDAFLGELT